MPEMLSPLEEQQMVVTATGASRAEQQRDEVLG
jgi:hypothetical protein